MMNVAVSGVVGPRERGHSEGAAVSEIYSTGVLSPGAPVIITAWSCVDQLDIAGIGSANGRVVGLMPHPEHAIEALTGPSDDGLGLFYSALDAVLTA